jgi:hypothetical protein
MVNEKMAEVQIDDKSVDGNRFEVQVVQYSKLKNECFILRLPERLYLEFSCPSQVSTISSDVRWTNVRMFGG